MGNNSASVRSAVFVMLLSLVATDALRVALRKLSTVRLATLGPDGSRRDRLAENVIKDILLYPPGKVIYALMKDVYESKGNTIHVVDVSDLSKLRQVTSTSIGEEAVLSMGLCRGRVVALTNNDNLRRNRILSVQPYTLQSPQWKPAPLYKKSDKGIFDIERRSFISLKMAATSDCRLVVESDEEAYAARPPGDEQRPGFLLLDSSQSLTELDFRAFDARFGSLSATGARRLDADKDFSERVDTQGITFNTNFTKAYVSLQANNAIAVLDLKEKKITAVHGLGFKDWAKSGLDTSSKDNEISITPWPIYGIYQPADIEYVEWGGESYLITANQGKPDNWKYGYLIGDDNISPTVTDRLKDAILRNNTQLAYIKFSMINGKNKDGKLEKFYTFGGRSFSLFRASDMKLVFDSGSDLEKVTAEMRPDLFNVDFRHRSDNVSDKWDSASRNLGPEPTVVTTAKLDDHLLIFVGTNKPGSVFVYSLAPGQTQPVFQTMAAGVPQQSDKTWQFLHERGQLDSVGTAALRYVQPGVLSSYPVLFLAGSQSGTITAYRVINLQAKMSTRKASSSPVKSAPVLTIATCLFLLRQHL